MLTGFSIRNFKSLDAVPQSESLLEFSPVNVLIGPNGCGKSSLLQAIDFLRAFFMSSVDLYLQERGWDFSDIATLRQAREEIKWHVRAELDAGRYQIEEAEYHYSVSLQFRKSLAVSKESLSIVYPNQKKRKLLEYDGKVIRVGGADKAGMYFEVPGSFPSSMIKILQHSLVLRRFPEILRFQEWVEGFRSFLIWDPKVLRAPNRGKYLELGPSGEHLAALIGHLKDSNPSGFRKLVKRISVLFPTVTDISVSGRGWGWRSIQLHEGSKVIFNSQQMSDGILRLLAIATLLYTDYTPSVVMFEEPENGMHPQLLKEVVQILREITLRKPPNQSQVFFTTHSPYVLDEFYDHPEQVYCMDRSAPLAGATVTRLSDTKQINRVKAAFEKSLGEAWTSGLIGR
jgi:predicted ATPase